VEIHSLFFNAPARRKFQKSQQANTSAIVKMVEQLALGHPDIQFSLESFCIFQEQVWKERIKEVLGDLSEGGIWIEQGRIKGFIGGPQKTRAKQFFLLNRRTISSSFLSMALREGVGTRIEERMHPVAVLFLDLSPAEFDVNVHPQKREVRFRDERALYIEVRNAIQHAFIPQNLLSHKKVEFTPPLSSALPWEEYVPSAIEQDLFEQSSGKALAVVGSFLLVEKKEGVFLVDLRGQQQKSRPDQGSQILIFPISIELAREDAPWVEQILERLTSIGCEVRRLRDNQLYLDAIPQWLEAESILLFVDAIKEGLKKGLPYEETEQRFLLEHPARLRLEEAEELWQKRLVGREIPLKAKDLERCYEYK